jgi:hypothetical protein
VRQLTFIAALTWCGLVFTANLPPGLVSLDPIPSEPLPRVSSLRFGIEGGTGDYLAGNVELNLGLSPHWSLIAAGDGYQLGPDGSLEAQVGFELEEKRSYTVRLTAQGRTGPSSLLSLGPALEATTWVNQAWDGRYGTGIAFDFSAIHFRFPILQEDGNRLDRLFWQGGVALGVVQELPAGFQVGISYARYYYTVSYSVLASFENRSLLLFPAASSGLVSGFPIDSWIADLRYSFHGSNQVRVGIIRSAVVDEDIPAYTLSLSAAIALSDHWLFSPQLNAVFQEASGPDYTGGVQMTYAW